MIHESSLGFSPKEHGDFGLKSKLLFGRDAARCWDERKLPKEPAIRQLILHAVDGLLPRRQELPMPISKINHPALGKLLAFLLLTLSAGLVRGAAEGKPGTPKVIEARCLDCHDAEEKKGGVDLSPLLGEAKPGAGAAWMELWTKAEEMIATGEMPPKAKKPLDPAQRAEALAWYRARFILKNGREQIGVTPLRRLTRYEIENTLEELLSVKLKQPYVYGAEMRGLLPSMIEQLYPDDILGESGFNNDAHQLHNVKVPLLKYLECLEYALRIFDQSADARLKVYGFADKPAALDPAKGEAILRKFIARAHRGSDNEEGVREILKAYTEAAKGSPPTAALLHGMKLALLSPGFLYRMEDVKDSAAPYPVTARELAVRLSYFLWSTMPDDELMAAARDGSLLREPVLRAQIQRMLNSPKRMALAENFAGQWLGFKELKADSVHYRGEQWTRGVYDELLFTFDEVIKSDRSILELVDAEWAYLNKDVAKELGAGEPQRLKESYADIFADRQTTNVKTRERLYFPPKLYTVNHERAGGVITAAGTMSLTSAPERTNPIRRGVWVLENIIGKHVEAPPSVPPLPEKIKVEGGKFSSAVVDVLKAHTERAECRSCHQHIDPLGLGLENFSPTGEWRTGYPKDGADGKPLPPKKRQKLQQDGDPVASAGVLPNGQTFHTPKELKKELLGCYQDQITENVTRRMLSYAIGRKLAPHDRVTIEKLEADLKSNGHRMSVLIEGIINSSQFRQRQDRT